MTQGEVLDYVLANDCFIYEQKIKDDGIYYFVRRNGTKKMVVIYPTIKNALYTKPAICHICATLGDLPVPEYAAEYKKLVKEAKDKAERVFDRYPQQGMN